MLCEVTENSYSSLCWQNEYHIQEKEKKIFHEERLTQGLSGLNKSKTASRIEVLVCAFFFFLKNLIICFRGEGQRGRDSQADSPLSLEPDAGAQSHDPSGNQKPVSQPTELLRRPSVCFKKF